MAEPYIKFMRNQRLVESLIKRNANAFVLLSIIAQRAKRTDELTFDGLEPGQALIGDWKNYGLTEQRYRTAKRQLETNGLATFEPTSGGTIATITSNVIYDINYKTGNEPGNERATSEQRAGNERVTSEQRLIKNERMKECNSSPPIIPPVGVDGSDSMKTKIKSFQKWTADELKRDVIANNGDGFFELDEINEFVDYWMEPGASGKTRLAREKSWSTRRRMRTAMDMVYSKSRDRRTRGSKSGFDPRDMSTWPKEEEI